MRTAADLKTAKSESPEVTSFEAFRFETPNQGISMSNVIHFPGKFKGQPEPLVASDAYWRAQLAAERRPDGLRLGVVTRSGRIINKIVGMPLPARSEWEQRLSELVRGVLTSASDSLSHGDAA